MYDIQKTVNKWYGMPILNFIIYCSQVLVVNLCKDNKNDIWELDIQYSRNNKKYTNAYYAMLATEPVYDENFDKYLCWGTTIFDNIMT